MPWCVQQKGEAPLHPWTIEILTGLLLKICPRDYIWKLSYIPELHLHGRLQCWV